ncbi:MAG: protoheme farnesyltransferase [Bacteroidetes bacterium]|nr:protoheme farnesyltransferase [Bacteroidota bacterium]MDF2451919.1 protoheme farnesyltransferase [Bacteroidota bacterium]
MQNESHTTSNNTIIYSKAKSFLKLTKFTLSALVVFSAIITYFTVAETYHWKQIVAICLGGFLVTAAANGFNQIIEKDLDKLMNRTRLRPIPTGNLSVTEALLFCAVFGITGTVLLWVFTNPLCGIIGFISIILYALVYTPLKRKTPFSVFIGAIPGALPTLIGAIAATEGFGEVTFFAILLFCIQFFWQFPHFWAIAWVSHDDYQRAGFFMLPSKGGRDKSSRSQILVYTLSLFPIALTPFVFNYTGWISATVVSCMGLVFIIQAYKLYRSGSIEDARKLMFGSFIYLPVVQVALMIGSKFFI